MDEMDARSIYLPVGCGAGTSSWLELLQETNIGNIPMQSLHGFDALALYICSVLSK